MTRQDRDDAAAPWEQRRVFPARRDVLPEVAGFLEEACDRALAGARDRARLALLVEELFTNTIVHGHGGDTDRPVTLTLRVDTARIGLLYEDTAPPHDPFAAVAAIDETGSVEDRPEGGLGVILIRSMAEDVEYSAHGGSNRIALALRLDPERAHRAPDPRPADRAPGQPIALIGLGLLGSALAENLLAAGFAVRGFDIAPERLREHAARGGVRATSPADAARGARVVVTCLMTGDIVREAVLGPAGAIETIAPGTPLVDCSTVHPDASTALARDLAGRGVPMLDAPIAGSSGQCRRREAPVLVGGDPAVFARCRPVLDAIARTVRHVGPNGAGVRAKLAVNLVLGLNRLALAEGLLFGLREGIDGPLLLSVLKESAAYSRAMDVKGDRMLEGRYEPEGKLLQHLKDVELMLAVGHANRTPLPATALHRQLLLAGVAAGLGERDNSSIMAVLRALAGLPA